MARRQDPVMHPCSSAWAVFPKGAEQSPEPGAETTADWKVTGEGDWMVLLVHLKGQYIY